ncbi:hypothetical protein [Stackebrandtia soli]|uniref:hypothetical protein n=1 Tax=Stackebrandtia soli TaxID=1892856 RepID=UPI0039EB33F8
MATCKICNERMANHDSGSICALCVAKIINWNHYEYDDDNDPAVKWAKRELLEKPNKPAAQNGCAVVALALMAIPAVLTAAGIGVANLIA